MTPLERHTRIESLARERGLLEARLTEVVYQLRRLKQQVPAAHPLKPGKLISRQYAKRLEKRERGECIWCPALRDPESKNFCRVHLVVHQARTRTSARRKAERITARPEELNQRWGRCVCGRPRRWEKGSCDHCDGLGRNLRRPRT